MLKSLQIIVVEVEGTTEGERMDFFSMFPPMGCRENWLSIV